MDHDTGLISCASSAFIDDQRIAEQRILTYIATRTEAATKEDLANHCGRRASVGRSAVDSLVAAGLLKVRGSGAKGDARLYSSISPKMLRPDSSSHASAIYAEESGVSDESTRGIARGTPDAGRAIPHNPIIPEIPRNATDGSSSDADEEVGDLAGRVVTEL